VLGPQGTTLIPVLLEDPSLEDFEGERGFPGKDVQGLPCRCANLGVAVEIGRGWDTAQRPCPAAGGMS
jgi:hypothetical protein